MRPLAPIVSLLALLAPACASNDAAEEDRNRVLAYDARDACTAHDDADACLADADRCIWYDLGAPCQEGEPCVSGVCQDIDPCRAYTDPESCTAATDERCAWADTELCPADDCGDGGFCYQVPEDDCTCVCPLACPEGEECPPCECDCSGGGGGEEDCVCSGTVCPEGDDECVPEPMECTCETEEGVVCPDAPDAESCAAVDGCGWVQSPCPLCPAPECGECEETYSCQYIGGDGGSGGTGGTGGTGGGSTGPSWDQ